MSTLRREREAAFAAERDAVEAAADEIGVGVHLPGGGAAGESDGREQRGEREPRRRVGGEVADESDHSFIST